MSFVQSSVDPPELAELVEDELVEDELVEDELVEDELAALLPPAPPSPDPGLNAGGS